MKKRIILFLTFLLTTMFLTGCTVSTSYGRIEKVNEVANEIAANGLGYKLPEGYYIKYPNNKDTGIIEITSIKEGKETINAKYKIEDGTAEVITIRIDDNADFFYFLLVVILMIVSGIIGALLSKTKGWCLKDN